MSRKPGSTDDIVVATKNNARECGHCSFWAHVIKAPLIKACLANIECKELDVVDKHNFIVLETIAAYVAISRQEKRVLHAVGDGTVIVDGRKLDR